MSNVSPARAKPRSSPGPLPSAASGQRDKAKKDARATGGRNTRNNASRDFSAIRRAVRAGVGKPWSEVFAGLKTRFPALASGVFADEGLAQSWGVAVKTSVKNGQVRTHLSGKVSSLENSLLEYYVDAESGLLLENGFLQAAKRREQERERARQAELSARMREVSDELQLHRLAGKWFAVELRSIESGDRGAHFDVVLNRTIPFSDREALHVLYGRRNIVGLRKRELLYRELRELKLMTD